MWSKSRLWAVPVVVAAWYWSRRRLRGAGDLRGLACGGDWCEWLIATSPVRSPRLRGLKRAKTAWVSGMGATRGHHRI